MRCDVVIVFLGGDRADVFVPFGERDGVPLASGRNQGSVKSIKSALEGPVVFRALGVEVDAQVPLARHPGVVAGRLEVFGDGGCFESEFPFVSFEPVILARHVADTGTMGVESGQHAGAGGAATSGVVELAETHPVSRELIDVRGLDFAPVAAEVREAHVIEHDDDHVGLLLRMKEGGEEGEQEQG